MVVSMNRAQLYLWSLLHAGEHQGDISLSDPQSQLARNLGIADPRQRRSDMEAAIGLWAERPDFSDTESYLRNLREDHRSHGLPTS